MTDNRALSEYQLQKDNQIIKRLEAILHYQAFVFPGSSVKKDISLMVSTRPIASYNVACDLTRQGVIDTLNFSSNDAYTKLPELVDGYQRYAIAALVLSLVMTVAGLAAGPGVFLFMIIGSSLAFGFTVHLRNLTIEVNDSLKERLVLPPGYLEIYNVCLNRQIDVAVLSKSQDTIMEL